MRDTNEGMIELLNTLKENDKYFAIIRINKENIHIFKFGISKSGYSALKKIFSNRPLERLPGVKYRHFWNGSFGGKIEGKLFIGIRYEVSNRVKTFDMEAPKELVSNLKWFQELECLEDAKHLEIEA